MLFTINSEFGSNAKDLSKNNYQIYQNLLKEKGYLVFILENILEEGSILEIRVGKEALVFH